VIHIGLHIFPLGTRGKTRDKVETKAKTLLSSRDEELGEEKSQ
jgi:hypothetical protein